MPDNPNTSAGSDDGNSTDAENEEIAMDAIEAEAGFLADRDPEEHPSVLRITSDAEQAHRQDAQDRLDRWEAGEEVPHVSNFQNPSDLRALLTDRRVELLRSIMGERPIASANWQTALTVMSRRSTMPFRSSLSTTSSTSSRLAGRSARSSPYDTIEVSLELSTPHEADDAAPA